MPDMKDPRPQLLAIITAERAGDMAVAAHLFRELTKNDLQRSLSFMITSHIRLIEVLAPFLNSTPDEMYREMGLEQSQ